MIFEAIHTNWSMQNIEMKYTNGRINIKEEMPENIFCIHVSICRNPPLKITL
jgi:hypothetical protein